MTLRASVAGTASSLWNACWNLIRSWWRVDAIRVSPSEGLLLRLSPADMFEWSRMLWQIESRSVGTGATGPFVSYRCRSEERSAVLIVTPTLSGEERVRWLLDGCPTNATSRDFQVWSATHTVTAGG